MTDRIDVYIEHQPQEYVGADVFCCTEKHRCKWQGFALHQGLGWGKIKDQIPEWLNWHNKECPGELIEIRFEMGPP